ncbi:FxSxx-COOH system tetratricopeptide repeat protein [Nonomuraea sp. NPDC050451]|uniref:FxSxx-COOH system tetratricopeptide repeat protein n=1 Tax=Nonomuraea sp. NPDC050451 TaxID=3364364 RepID=UPI00378B443A
MSDDPRTSIEGRASGHGRVYQAGRDLIIHETVPTARPVEQVAASPRTVNLPHVGLFVGRDEELAALEAALERGGEVVVAAVHGLGGVGKSTLAARYARAQATVCNPVWWITADSPTAVQAGLAALAAALEPELAAALPLEVLAERVCTWLAAHDGWLLVLDDVTDPADVAPLLGRTLSGRVLVTSRLGQGWHRLGAQVLQLDVLPESDAVDLLTQTATPGQRADGLEGAPELVRELGCLPLAIEQAGAYLYQTRLAPGGYLQLLREYPALMHDRAARGAAAERTIARIWRLTLARLADTPLAGDLLRILAWYGAEPIPRTLLDGLAVGPPQVQHALGELAAYNMITFDGQTVTVHRLVQAVARTADPDDPHRRAADIDTARGHATSLLDDAVPVSWEDPAGWPTWRALLPHVEALVSHTTPDADTATIARLLNLTGLFLNDQGAIARAIASLERARTVYERVLGADHPDTLTSRNNLAAVHYAAGDLGRAIPVYEATLADRERVLGADHPDTLSSRNNLAATYQAAGDLGRAIPLYEATLTDCERVLGVDHPSTLKSRSNLAYAYQAAGDLGRAIPLYEATLTACEQVLGADHPATLTFRSNLGAAYALAGDLGRAVPLLEATLADRERVLGADHPSALKSRSNLAGAYQAAGDLGRAIPLYEQTLADRERVLGADHPDTLDSLNHLAYAYGLAGDLGRAIPLYEQTLADCERVLGPDHPVTKVVQANLAAACE